MQDILVNLVDSRANSNPEALYAKYPASPTSFNNGYKRFTYRNFADAINAAAWWLEKNLGRSNDFETIAYIGPNDLRYNVFVIGAVKAGYKLLLTSPRNSIAAHLNLFNLLQCCKLLAADQQSPTISTLAVDHGIEVLNVPPFGNFLDPKTPHYSYTKSFASSSSDPFLALHTSGSTGLPKPLVITHAFLAAYLSMTQLAPPPGFESQDILYQGNRLLFMLPPFHAANHCVTLCNAIFHHTVIIYPLSGAIPTAQVLADALRHTTADAALVPPTVVAVLGKNSELLEFVAGHLDTLAYAGGDIPQALGQEVASKMKLVNIYGVSELSVPPQIRPTSNENLDDWTYLSFHPDSGVTLEPYSEDLYELCVPKGSASGLQQPVFTLYPDREKFSTGDLFTHHPSKHGSWTYSGRKDDIIVFLTGEKANPTSMEERINSHEEVRSTLVAGSQRFQASALIELVITEALSTSEQAEVLERLWPTVQEANKQCPNYARVDKAHILIVSPVKPMLKSGKGTVQRRATLTLYAEELNALYEAAEEATPPPGDGIQQPHDAADLDNVSHITHDTVTEVTGWEALNNEDNFFVLGMDSLQAILLARGLRQRLRSSDIAISIVYRYPSVSSLAHKISDLLVFGQQSELAYKEERRKAVTSIIEEHKTLIDGFESDLQMKETIQSISGTEVSEPADKTHTVILTGSTGNLGSHLLQVLRDNPNVTAVYCLNRTSNTASNQVQLEKPSSCQVYHLSVDLTQQFGLEEAMYQRLLRKVTIIIHNAWPVNFNLPLSAFRPQLTRLVQLVRFTASAAQHPTLFFTSSISSVLNAAGDGQLIPESIISDTSAPPPMGYAESKFIAELLLDHASKRLGIDARVARVGQIAGPVKSEGVWNMQEWLPRLVLSSLHVGAVPDSLGANLSSVSWLPVDLLAEMLLELSLSDKRRCGDYAIPNGDKSAGGTGAQVFHLLNPQAVAWTSLFPSIKSAFNTSKSKGREVETLSLQEWIRRVRESARACDGGDVEAMLEANPAAKILDFFEGLGIEANRSGFTLAKTMQASPKLRAMEGIKWEWMERWLSGWLGVFEGRN